MKIIAFLLLLFFCSPGLVDARENKSEKFEYLVIDDAVKEGDLQAVKKYSENFDINSLSEFGFSTLLHGAAWEGKLEIVDYALKRGANIELRPGQFGPTAIEYAAINGHVDVVRFLVEKGAKVDALSAAAIEDVDLLGKLIKKDKTLLSKKWNLHALRKDLTLLQFAALYGSSKSVALLIALGMDLQGGKDKGVSPLHLAAAYGKVDALKEILKHDKNIDGKGKNNWTALCYSACRGEEHTARILIESGAEYGIFSAVGLNDLNRVRELVGSDSELVNLKFWGYTPLMWAARLREPALLEYLIANGADINAHEDSLERSVLEEAVHFERVEVVKSLLAYDKLDKSIGKNTFVYGTALHFAAWMGNLQIVKLLVDADFELDAPSSNGLTALTFAADHGHIDIVKLLLDAGANPNGVGKGHASPLHRAVWAGKTKTVELLLKHGAKFVLHNDGDTTLRSAALMGPADIVKILLKKNIDVSKVNNQGATALHLAAKCSAVP